MTQTEQYPSNPSSPGEPGEGVSSGVAGQGINRLRLVDYFLLILFCGVLFGYVAISGRPMTMHEARLPQLSREMMRTGDYLIPHNGPRPWLERPPLPHWVEIIFAKAIGQNCDTEWSVRIPPAIMGTLVVLVTATMAAGWFGRVSGLLAGFSLASMYEFYYYSTLSEDDIFLAALVIIAVALFVFMEFRRDPEMQDKRLGFVEWRPWPVVAFFILMGLSNLAKGPGVGAIVVAGTLGVYLLWQRDWRRIRRYIWFWGWLIFIALALWWHVVVGIRYPEYLKNLRYDFADTNTFDQPVWYYVPQLLGVAMPWTPAALVGLFITARGAFRVGNRAERFLWCWAIVPIVILSIPHRKHHHYLVPSLAPWAILAAVGLPRMAKAFFAGPEWSRRPKFGMTVFGLPVAIALAILLFLHKIPGPQLIGGGLIGVWLLCVWMYYHGLLVKRGGWLFAAILLGAGVTYCWGQTYWPDETVPDTQFLRRVNAEVPADKLLTLDAAVGPLDFFRDQFYLRDDTLLLHNLSYLRSNDIHTSEVYVVARLFDQAPLQTLGDVMVIDQSEHSRRQKKPGQQLALFHLVFKPDLIRYSPPAISPMQAMEREAGPNCGPELSEGGPPPE
ncbi:MAG: glycosyltransferase family 39 protein [Tepidisphaeraceae bacterium]|jgi:4-amino-4-deoxy-L-arabinose transferase-like glycosyltransferase